MEKGNEGDEIIFLSLQQINCNIPNDVTKIGQIHADFLVDIIVKSIYLITNGDVEFPTLPQNIASRHRICTSIATKIKELGYLGDCGYNQLLYPVETQTRDLLKWLVQKLPRSEEEGVQEVILGANALMNKRIMQTLLDWKRKPYTLHFCSTKSSTSRLCEKPYRTVPNLLQKETKLKSIFQKSCQYKLSLESSLFERHASELVKDSQYSLLLENEFNDTNINENALENSRSKKSISKTIQDAISKAKKDCNVVDPHYHHVSGQLPPSSLQELLQKINDDYKANNVPDSSSLNSLFPNKNNSSNKGSRFSHAVEFGQEESTSIAVASLVSTSSMVVGNDIKSSAMKNRNHIIDNDNDNATDHVSLNNKKTSLEYEEKIEEINQLRNEIQQQSNDIDKMINQHKDNLTNTKKLEEELSLLIKDSESLEKEILLKRKTLELLPEATANISKLKDVCAADVDRLVNLKREWEQHKQPLLDDLKEKENIQLDRREKGREMVDEIKKYREVMTIMIDDLKEKQERVQILSEEKSKLPRNINRTMYTHRIMDITSSLVKQNADIIKITSDIRDIQKTINLNTNTLKRVDAITEELIYSAAYDKNDPVMIDTYRRLITLRNKFNELIEIITKIGQQVRVNRDLETKIEQEEVRIASNNINRIKKDLDVILIENSQLVSQIKATSISKNIK